MCNEYSINYRPLGMLAIVLSDSAVNMDIDIFRQSVSVSLYVHVCVHT